MPVYYLIRGVVDRDLFARCHIGVRTRANPAENVDECPGMGELPIRHSRAVRQLLLDIVATPNLGFKPGIPQCRGGADGSQGD